MEGLIVNVPYTTFNLNGTNRSITSGHTEYDIVLDLSDEPECLQACIDWCNIITTYFKTSYKAYRIDIGPYEGLWPISCDPNGKVQFHLDNVDQERKDWKDWFIKGDFEYASE